MFIIEKFLRRTDCKFRQELNNIKIIDGSCLIKITMILSGFNMKVKWLDPFCTLKM